MDRRNRTRPSNVDKNWRHRNKNSNNNNDNNANAPSGFNGNRRGPGAYQTGNKSNPRQNRGGRGGQQQFKGPYFNFGRLDQLNSMIDDDVVTKLAEKKGDFEELLNNDMRPDILVLTLRLLTKVCRANFTEIVTGVLSHACSPVFLKNLEAFLTKLPFENTIEKINNKLYHEDKNGFWSNLNEFFKKVMELLPSKARDELATILQKVNPILMTVESSHGYKIDQKIKDDASALSNELEGEIKRLGEKKKESETCPREQEVEEKPPEDFRSLSVIPTRQDLYDQKPYIRPCKIKDAYDSIEHYLDVQFRLLREDFLIPLRNGIQEYLQGEKKQRNQDVRVYKSMTLISPEVGRNKNNVGIKASFGVIKNIKWRNTKRFMYGGLLLLSRDNFHTILFATVANRDEKDLENGFLLIEPCPGTEITRDLYGVKFVMLESKIYFEPYLAVLSAMKLLNEQNFPMENYLVNADTSIRLPRYLTEDSILQYKDFLELPVGGNQIWPRAERLQLDETQYSAFKCALTQEFAVIQGPPGTGKTFIALKIVETLLENEKYWRTHGPIVVVCLTNHALDQFLEGILKYTKSIVRIGARSQSELLKPYTLIEKRKTVERYARTAAWSLMYETKHEYEDVLRTIDETRLIVTHLQTPNAIVPLYSLQEFCYDVQLSQFSSNEKLVNWLIGIDGIPFTGKSLSFPQEENVAEVIPEEEREDDQNVHMDDDLEFTYKFKVDEYNKPIFPIRSIDAFIDTIHRQMAEYKKSSHTFALPFDPTIEWEEDLNLLYEQRLSLQHLLDHHPLLMNRQRHPLRNPRWRMYWNWVTISHENAMNKLAELDRRSHGLNLELGEAKQLVDLAVMRNFNIIGLTTTAAAKQHASLRSLSASIVLVEEAAEILEAHVVCSLTKNCMHTILIGDHKQLRPKASVYNLGTKFNLNVSLFERMVNIRGDCTQLAHQHRMRPEIAKLIHPSIYDVLHNDESVLDYPNVKGLVKNLFFLNHNKPEASHNNEESWINQHEVEFLVAFARHLLLQGYIGKEITILCTYTGQLFALRKETGHYSVLREVRVTTIDNYQGEENRIILLSLVRNNGEGNIGFLKEENRVCVALSRAREGLYIMGNMADLMIKNTIWPKIKEVLEDEDAIGDSLELRCQIHSNETIQVQKVSDFQQCPEGGCSKKCDADLPCGHSCTSICHILDREHAEYRCKQPCTKSCTLDHPCPLKCWEGCRPCNVKVERQLMCEHVVEMPCGKDPDTFPCYIKVDAILPDCNHDIKKPCYLPYKDCNCLHPCEIRLPCGHTCQWTCHTQNDPDHIEYKCYKVCPKRNVDCENHHPCKKRCHEECEPCPIIVEKTRSCGHYFKKIKCSVNVEALDCLRICKREMSCGHTCQRKCYEDCRDCQEKVTKVSSCGHTIEVKCCEQATPAKCGDKCQRKLACGHSCTKKCKETCTEACKVMVKQTEPGLCGHIVSVPCYLRESDSKSRELLKYCKEPCGTQLTCDHICGGTCGTCKQGRIHLPCTQSCGNILVCGHQCDIPCRLECQPCKKKCEIKCRHNRCGKKCGMPCTPCKESCAWGCEHRKCGEKCFELCDIEPCNEPCKKLLKCDHPCVGFCGDPCPPLCRICDKEELTEIFLGHEDEPDARFVLLEDCSHCVESNGLLDWISRDEDEIKMKVCPRCKTPIRKCMRIMNQIKDTMNFLQLVKQEVFGDRKVLKEQQIQHLETVKALIQHPVVTEFPVLNIVLQKLRDQGTPVKNQRKQILNKQELEAFRVILEILRQIIKILTSMKKDSNTFYRIGRAPTTTASYQFVKDQVAMLGESIPTKGGISRQQIADIELELDRLSSIVDIFEIDVGRYNDGFADSYKANYDALIAKVLDITKYTDTKKLELRKEMHNFQYRRDVQQERTMIVKAMGFTQGHWFKCPNGHIYAIGECGGAMEQSTCNECGAVIGGQSHRLESGNSLAREMDGASRSAWSGTGMM